MDSQQLNKRVPEEEGQGNAERDKAPLREATTQSPVRRLSGLKRRCSEEEDGETSLAQAGCITGRSTGGLDDGVASKVMAVDGMGPSFVTVPSPQPFTAAPGSPVVPAAAAPAPPVAPAAVARPIPVPVNVAQQPPEVAPSLLRLPEDVNMSVIAFLSVTTADLAGLYDVNRQMRTLLSSNKYLGELKATRNDLVGFGLKRGLTIVEACRLQEERDRMVVKESRRRKSLSNDALLLTESALQMEAVRNQMGDFGDFYMLVEVREDGPDKPPVFVSKPFQLKEAMTSFFAPNNFIAPSQHGLYGLQRWPGACSDDEAVLTRSGRDLHFSVTVVAAGRPMCAVLVAGMAKAEDKGESDVYMLEKGAQESLWPDVLPTDFRAWLSVSWKPEEAGGKAAAAVEGGQQLAGGGAGGGQPNGVPAQEGAAPAGKSRPVASLGFAINLTGAFAQYFNPGGVPLATRYYAIGHQLFPKLEWASARAAKM